MGNDWQTWLVLALVLLAAAYSVWYLLPASLKKPLGALHQALASSPACGACNSCGKCATPSPSLFIGASRDGNRAGADGG